MSDRPVITSLEDTTISWLRSEFQELAECKVVFGLQAQGHVSTIEAMLAEGESWDQIGLKIGWCPETAQRHFEALSQPDRGGVEIMSAAPHNTGIGHV